MKELIAIKLQSYVDLITNSSSELFQLKTDLSLEQVKEILSTITSGYLEPILFDLKEYREFKKNPDSNHLKFDVYDSMDGWFYDPKNPEDVYEIYKYYLSGYYSRNEPLQIEFEEFVNNHEYFIDPKRTYMSPYNIEDEAFSKFIDSHIMPDVYTANKKAYLYSESIENLDGCILVLSKEDNSIPYETWDDINKIFNGKNYHLG